MKSAETLRPRRRGRPAADDPGSGATRAEIISLAGKWAKTARLEEISFVQLADALGVAPGSIHYHVGTKDALTSAVINAFYQKLLQACRRSSGGAQGVAAIEVLGRTMERMFRLHSGVALHIQAHSRYRLFQNVAPGEADHGAAFLDYAFTTFREAGFKARQVALFYHALAMHCLAAATSGATRLSPQQHKAFLLKKRGELVSRSAPGLSFALEAFAGIDSSETFELGLSALLERFERARV